MCYVMLPVSLFDKFICSQYREYKLVNIVSHRTARRHHAWLLFVLNFTDIFLWCLFQLTHCSTCNAGTSNFYGGCSTVVVILARYISIFIKMPPVKTLVVIASNVAGSLRLYGNQLLERCIMLCIILYW